MKLSNINISKATPGGKLPVKPSVIHQALDKRLSGLPEAKRFISTRLALHLKRAVDLAGGNGFPDKNQCILILGPSGAGKTFLVEQAASITKIPFVAASAASLTSEGYAGQSLSDVLHRLLKAAPNAKMARYGICFLDEWDKRVQQNFEKAGFSQGVQGEILRMMEGTEVEIETRPLPGKSNPKFDTKGLMFVFAGAFEGLDQLAGSPAERRVAGFAHGEESVFQPVQEPRMRDALVAYGVMREFINRLSGILTLPAPTIGDMQQLLKFGNGPVEACNKRLRGLGAELVVDEQAAEAMAAYACETKSYCRGLQALLQGAVDQVVYEDIKGQITIEYSDMKRLAAGKRVELDQPVNDKQGKGNTLLAT